MLGIVFVLFDVSIRILHVSCRVLSRHVLELYLSRYP